MAHWWLLACAPACGRIGYDDGSSVPVDGRAEPGAVDGSGGTDSPPPGDADAAGPEPDVAPVDTEADGPAPDRGPDVVSVDVVAVDAGPEAAIDQRATDSRPVQPAACPEGGRVDPQTGHCYYSPAMSAMLWPEAQIACVATAGHLATITSAAELAFALGSLGGEERWIGLFRNGTGPYQWVTGEPVSFTAWAPLEPDEATDGRARLAPDGWHDTDVRRRFLTLCERDP